MKLTIYGTGYVGLVTGACLSEIGHEVLCIDIDKEKIANLQNGILSIYEPGLAELVERNRANHRLLFDHDVARGVNYGTLQIITVNTPTIENQGADISNILAVASSMACHMTDHKIIVNKSTAPPGTARQIRQSIENTLHQLQKSITFDVASNPEFLKEGAAIKDFMDPDRIIIGLENDNAREMLAELYQNFTGKLVFTDPASAELSKYAANAMLATKISFMNELSNIAEKIGADIEEVKYAMSLDPRIGPHFINPGCGYGGSCFPKDVKALSCFAQASGVDPVLLNAVEQVNHRQKKLLAQKLLTYFDFNIENKIIALWGLAFKPDTNDMREASSITLMKMLWHHGAIVQAYDPIAAEETKKLFPHEIEMGKLILCPTAISALTAAEGLAIVTEWSEFKNLSDETILELFQSLPVFDGRNIYDAKHFQKMGIEYFGIGREI